MGATTSQITDLTKSLFVGVIAMIIVYIVEWRWRKRHYYRLASKIHGPPALPLIGNALMFMGRADDLLNTLSGILYKYDDPVKVWLGNHLYFLITKPEYFKSILNNSKCLNKADVYDVSKIFLGNGIFNVKAKVWKEHRKSINRAFNQKVLNSYVSVFYRNAVDLEKDLEQELNKVFDPSFHIDRRTLTMICATTMGIQMNDTERLDQLCYLHSIMMINYEHRLSNPIYENDLVFRNLPIGRNIAKWRSQFTHVTNEIIAETRLKMSNNPSNSDENNGEMKSFLELLLEMIENGERFTDSDVKDELATLLVAGVDTTAILLSFALVMLGMHPNVQEAVYQEVLHVVGPTARVDHQHLYKLKYVDRFLSETMRLFPIALAIGRKLDENILLDDKVLPKGSDVILYLFHTHRSEKYWPDPLRFDPDRFLPEQVAKRHPYAYMPFAKGLRNCVGTKYGIMALKTFVSHLVRRFKLSTPYKSVQTFKVRSACLLRPIDGHKIMLELRKE